MQPDNISPAARIPKVIFSDDMMHFQSKTCVRAPILRPKRHDSINRIIAETCHYSQRLDARSALREASCGFFAAGVLALGRFLCKQATLVESTPPHRRLAATNGKWTVNAPVMKP